MTKSRSNTKKRGQPSQPRRKSTPRKRVVLKTRKPNDAVMVRTMFGDCARDYLKCVHDPFSGVIACVPSAFNAPSLKVRREVKGTFTTGTNGVGFIVLSPGKAVCSDTTPILATASTYTGTGANCPYSTATGVNSFPFISDYNSATNEDSALVRVVACGLRIKNRTPIMNRGAVVYGWESPNHSTLASTASASDPSILSLNSWSQDDSCDEVSADNGAWASVVYHPLNADETTFDRFADVPVDYPTNQSIGNYILGFNVTSITTAQVFAFEAVVVYEVMGVRPGGETPSLSDPNGFAAVQNIFQNPATRVPMIGERFPKLKAIIKNAGQWASYGAAFAGAVQQISTLL